MRNYKNELQEMREEKRNPTIVGNIVKRIIKKISIWRKKN